MGTQRFFLAARLDSFRCAGNGIAVMMRSQHNAWLHAIATVVVCLVAFYLGVTRDEWCCIVLTMVAVWSAEVPSDNYICALATTRSVQRD